LLNGNSVYQYGNTIRFECNFFDFDDANVDPQLIKLIIYSNKYEIIHENILGAGNKVGVGEYFFDYITTKEIQKYYYEWYGEINGTPSIKRGQFSTVFI
jgi:hypothetical protein